MTKVAPGVHQALSGYVNAFVIEADDGLVLIDTGLPKSESRILRAIAAFGHRPDAIRHIIVTHAHPDHMGSLAALLELTGAQSWVHEVDAPYVEAGTFPPIYPGPGLFARLLYFATRFAPRNVAPARVDRRVKDGDELPGGLVALHAPGHSPGQIALMRPGQNLLFAADTAMNFWRLSLSLMNENQALARQTAARIAGMEFDVAFFGHGAPMLSNAAAQFRKTFGQA
jgi:glyoxylase-like metal-dependent hydrolase (beta-lactamase superfamily II)